MAESQLVCMEDGHIGVKVPESKPEFYYSEEQRAALEELLKNGDGAFKTRLKDDKMTDFLSAREVKVLTGAFRSYSSEEDEHRSRAEDRGDVDSGVHSTYWPQMSDTDVPQLDIGWPGGGLFKGVTRISVHTHPPKDNGPHIKEVVRRLIQEANKVIAIVMDLLTDLQILQDLMDAAFRRSVPVYILLDKQGVPHFLDMCSRLQMGAPHLRNIRVRTLQGVGFYMSFGKLPGSLSNKYMLIDGDKVMFGSYSFSWATSRMDRNMITVITGQVVDFFDRDFRELYAISENMDLYKEFNVSRPAAGSTATIRSKLGPKRPPLPATTSRFQVSLGDPLKDKIEVPAHKYYNPKYLLVSGEALRPTGSLQEKGSKKGSAMLKLLEEIEDGQPRVTTSEKLDRMSPLPSEAPSDTFRRQHGESQNKKEQHTWKQRLFSKKSSNRPTMQNLPNSTSGLTQSELRKTEEAEDKVEVVGRASSRWRGKKLGKKSESQQTINAAHENESVKSRGHGKKKCTIS